MKIKEIVFTAESEPDFIQRATVIPNSEKLPEIVFEKFVNSPFFARYGYSCARIFFAGNVWTATVCELQNRGNTTTIAQASFSLKEEAITFAYFLIIVNEQLNPVCKLEDSLHLDRALHGDMIVASSFAINSIKIPDEGYPYNVQTKHINLDEAGLVRFAQFMKRLKG